MVNSPRLRSYGRLASAWPALYEPATVPELAELLPRLPGRRVTFMGGGHSFDDQALNDDVVISLGRLNGIGPLEGDSITVQAGARWEDILASLCEGPSPWRIPYVLVTTGRATAGGTASANCLSRSSCFVGREGLHVKRLRLMTVEGECYECSENVNGDLFRAAIGGFGYLGAIVDVTYALKKVAGLQIETKVECVEGFSELLPQLRDQTIKLAGELGTEGSPEWDAVSGVAFLDGRRARGLLCTSRHTKDAVGNRFPLFRPKHVLRPPVEWAMRIPFVNRSFWKVAYRFVNPNRTYVNDLDDYTFFMDGHRRAKEWAARFGRHLPTFQVTYVLPGDDGKAGGVAEDEPRAEAFLTGLLGMLEDIRLQPTLFDILFMMKPDKERGQKLDEILLSPNNVSFTSEGLSGDFVISIAFEDLSTEGLLRLREKGLGPLNDLCVALGGRISLVKGVYVTPGQIEAMYGAKLGEFMNLKQELDPGGVLRNDFFNKVFGSSWDAPPPYVPPLRGPAVPCD